MQEPEKQETTEVNNRTTGRRTWIRDMSALTGLAAFAAPLAMLQGCGGGGEADESPPTAETTPDLGAHGLAFLEMGQNSSSLAVGPLTTQAGSTILVCVGRGTAASHSLPTDNKDNIPYLQLDTTHTYNLWPFSGTALYAFPSAAGGAGHQVTVMNVIDPDDEVTLAVVEVRNGGLIKDVQWNEVLLASNDPVTSKSVVTTGPATLVAFWWGDHISMDDKTADPNNGFTVVDAILREGSLVQCAVATKNVPAAGTYNVTWTATPAQGAQLWLVAVQSSA